jgi:mono/diheme cytochrome c family protein
MRSLPAALIILFVASSAWAGDAGVGHTLAQRWCASCHAVEPMPSQVKDVPPPFVAIASSPGQNQAKLYAWLQAPHPSMPDLQLSRQNIDDIVTYIQSLRSQP